MHPLFAIAHRPAHDDARLRSHFSFEAGRHLSAHVAWGHVCRKRFCSSAGCRCGRDEPGACESDLGSALVQQMFQDIRDYVHHRFTTLQVTFRAKPESEARNLHSKMDDIWSRHVVMAYALNQDPAKS